MKSEGNISSLNNHNSQNSHNLIDGEIICSSPNGKIKIKGDDLKPINIYAYSVGHVLNDLTATCWFSFLLYYLTDIIQIDKKKAGWVMLSGQIFDGIATPIVGILSDKFSSRIGRRSPWYIGGTIGVVICFSLIFQKCEICKQTSNPALWEMIYYISLPSLFNIAWASVQVSHMSLLPSISINRKNRDHMVRLRTAFTFSSQLVCLMLSLFIFYYVHDKYQQYSILSLICVGIGTLASFFFIFYCREVELIKNIPRYYDYMRESLKFNQNDISIKAENFHDKDNKDSNNITIDLKSNKNCLAEVKNLLNDKSNNYYLEDNNLKNIYGKQADYNTFDVCDKRDKLNIPFEINHKNEMKKTIEQNEKFNNEQKKQNLGILYWLKKPTFYKYIIIYMLVRISINVTTSMLPYYLESILGIQKTLEGGTPIQISLIYLFQTTGCLFNSLYMQKFLEKYNSRSVLMFSAWIFSLIGLLPILFLNQNFYFPIYILGFLFGIGFALGLSSASSLINDVVGAKGDQAAFVYGAYSLTDKFSCGILLFIFVDYVKDNYLMLKYIIPILPVSSLFLALIIVKSKSKTVNDQEKPKSESDLEMSKSLIDNSKFSFISLE